ncbi:MAG: hypothetical protein ACLFPQ_04735 [Candidatus Woesearchaeota archaeon]
MRGRPCVSEIRQNIVELLFCMGSGHGYEIYKKYIDLFPGVTQRSIYYHLRKGLSLNEFAIDSIKKEKGDYSWGTTAEKIYYKLGKNAVVKGSKRVDEYFNKKVKK